MPSNGLIAPRGCGSGLVPRRPSRWLLHLRLLDDAEQRPVARFVTTIRRDHPPPRSAVEAEGDGPSLHDAAPDASRLRVSPSRSRTRGAVRTFDPRPAARQLVDQLLDRSLVHASVLGSSDPSAGVAPNTSLRRSVLLLAGLLASSTKAVAAGSVARRALAGHALDPRTDTDEIAEGCLELVRTVDTCRRLFRTRREGELERLPVERRRVAPEERAEHRLPTWLR